MIMLTFHGTIRNSRLVIPVEQLRLREQFLSSMKDGARVIETLRREGRPKTVQQVRAHFGLAVQMVRDRMIEFGYAIYNVAPSREMVHEILKLACGGVGDGGESLGLSQMTTSQASKFFENVRDWAATELHLIIPDPDPNWRDKKSKEDNGEA